MISNNVWTRIKREHGLYRYNPSGQYFARVRFRGKLYRRKLSPDDLALAKRKLRDFKNDLERTDATKGNTSFAKVLDDYAKTLGGSASTKEKKLAVIEKLRKTWFGIDSLPLRTVKPSQVETWLTNAAEPPDRRILRRIPRPPRSTRTLPAETLSALLGTVVA